MAKIKITMNFQVLLFHACWWLLDMWVWNLFILWLWIHFLEARSNEFEW